MLDKNQKKQIYKDNNKNKYSNITKKKFSKDEKEETEVFNIKKLDEVKQLLQQSASSQRSLRNQGSTSTYSPNNNDKNVRFNIQNKNEFEPDSLTHSTIKDDTNQLNNKSNNINEQRQYRYSHSPNKKTNYTMDEDLDQELQNLKSINSKKDLDTNLNRTSSPIYQPSKDYNEESGTFNPDLKLIQSDTNESMSLHDSQVQNNNLISPQMTFSINYKNKQNQKKEGMENPINFNRSKSHDNKNTKNKNLNISHNEIKQNNNQKSSKSFNEDIKIKLSDIPLRFRNKYSQIERDIFEFQNYLTNIEQMKSHRREFVIHLTNLLEGLFDKVTQEHNEETVPINHQSSLQADSAAQQADRIKELVDENEQLRQRLNVYRNTENQNANSVELIHMLKNSQLQIENSNDKLKRELDTMKSEKENMIKEWEKQVVELTYSMDSLKKRVQGDKLISERDKKSNRDSRNTNGSDHKDSRQMYLDNYLE